MKIKVIQSGSKGNCTLVICDNTKLLIDLGISYKQLLEALQELNVDINEITGLLVTHNHKDHIKGIDTFIKNTNIKVFIPKELYPSLKEEIKTLKEDNCIFIDEIDKIGPVETELIHTSHDAPFSVGYNITYKNKELCYVTDTGYINRKYLNKMKNKDIYIIESNHDEKMLMDGPYPRFLKDRVISDTGHLSNSTTSKYLKKLVGDKTKTIILAHLSEKNNTEEKALEEIKSVELDKKIKILIARQYEESEMIEV